MGKTGNNSYSCFWYTHNNLKTDLFIVENAKLQADHGLCSVQQSPIGVQLPAIHQVRLKSIQISLLAGTPEGHILQPVGVSCGKLLTAME